MRPNLDYFIVFRFQFGEIWSKIGLSKFCLRQPEKMTQTWYDLPKYYDISFSHDMGAELDFLKKIFRKYCPSKTVQVLEPACGTGRLILPLMKAGFDCTGFDQNEHALEYLKKN